MINENASGEVNQEEHDRKYKVIQDRYDAIEKELNKLNDEKGKKVGAAERIRIFAANLEKNGQFLTEFSKKLWTMLVESVTVTNDKKVKFRYYSGYENEVEI